MEDEKTNTPEPIPADQQQNSDGTGGQQNDAVTTQEQAAAVQQPVGKVKFEMELEDTSFLDTKKYGTDPKEALVKQAKSYKSAVKEMSNAMQKRAETERENELLKQQLSQFQQQPQYGTPQYSQFGNAVPDQYANQIKQLYGDDVSIGNLIAQRDIVKSTVMEAVEPMFRTLAQNELEKQIDNIRESDNSLEIPEVQSSFLTLISKLPYNEQIKRNTITKCLNEAKGMNAQLIIDKGIEKGLQDIQSKGKPVTSTITAKPNSQVQTPEPEVVEISKELENNLTKWNIEPDVVKSTFSKSKNGGRK